MRKRVLLAGFFHETHTFLEGSLGLRDFKVQRGGELIDRPGGDSPIDGLLEVAQSHDWALLPLVDVRTLPGPMLEDQVVELFWQEFKERATPLLEEGVDAIYLILHGASVSRSLADVEGELLARIRALPQAAKLPICGVVDLHANFSAAMAAQTQGLVAYRENPHTDSKAAAAAGAELLERILASGKQPKTYWRHPPVMWPPTGVATADSPMCDLETLARSLEETHPEFAAVNVLAGFSFADTPDTGVSFTVITYGEEDEAQHALDELCRAALELREAGIATDAPFDSILPQLARHDLGLAVIAEPSDNIGGGSAGDGTGLLRCFVEHDLQNAAVVINDPAAVAELGACAVGDSLPLAIGGKISSLDAGPLELNVEYLSASDGQFLLEDPHSHLASIGSSNINMGPCAVVRHGGVRILLTSIKTPPFDLGQLRSQGIVPESLSVLGAKAAIAHRQAFRNFPCTFFSVDTPGPCSSNLNSLPFQKVRRPVYPLDR